MVFFIALLSVFCLGLCEFDPKECFLYLKCQNQPSTFKPVCDKFGNLKFGKMGFTLNCLKTAMQNNGDPDFPFCNRLSLPQPVEAGPKCSKTESVARRPYFHTLMHQLSSIYSLYDLTDIKCKSIAQDNYITSNEFY